MTFPLNPGRNPRRGLAAAAVLLLCAVAALGVPAAVRGIQTVARASAGAAASPSSSLDHMLPAGALLTIESPDFGALLHDWNASPQQKAWLASDNAAVFSNSRLFGRLHDAQDEFFHSAFAATSRTPTPTAPGLLTQVAGGRSIFAWYDVGNLEFLYITRIGAAQAGNSALWRARSSFSARQAAGRTFYIRQGTGDAAAAASGEGKARTVAFAQVSDPAGDLLLLATREDLIANALELIARGPTPQVAASDAAAPQSVAEEPWFTEASAALAPSPDAPPVLHMVLNLDRLVPLPYFRSYWVQRNITQMKQYRAAVSDLYRDTGQLREERALTLRSPEDPGNSAPGLEALASLAPAGVFRAQATVDPAAAVNALEEKLLGPLTPDVLPAMSAPDPSLDTPHPGAASDPASDRAPDFETRIDAIAPISAAASNRALADAVKSAGFDALLTWSTALPPSTPEGLWVPLHSAVVLHGASPWSAQALQSALQQSLRGSLTTANLGIDFRPETAAGQTLYTLSGPKPLFFAVAPASARGNLCLFADDRALLLSLLRQAALPPPPGEPATLVAGFDHSSQRGPFVRLTSLVDGTNQARPPTAAPTAPAFFSGNLRSLSDAFAALASERFVERRSGPNLRQTVTYTWQAP